MVIQKNLWYYKLDDMTSLKIARKIKRYYFNSKKSLEEFSANVEKFYNDMLYAELYPTTINIIARKQTTPSIYLYNFTYDGELNYQKQTFLPRLFCWTTSLKGAVHADDAFYWMGGFLSEISQKDKKIVDQMGHFFRILSKQVIQMMANLLIFIGNRTYTLDEPCYTHFDDPLEMKEGRFHEDFMKFWDEILQFIETAKRNEIKHLRV